MIEREFFEKIRPRTREVTEDDVTKTLDRVENPLSDSSLKKPFEYVREELDFWIRLGGSSEDVIREVVEGKLEQFESAGLINHVLSTLHITATEYGIESSLDERLSHAINAAQANLNLVTSDDEAFRNVSKAPDARYQLALYRSTLTSYMSNIQQDNETLSLPMALSVTDSFDLAAGDD